jgi:uncharacterized membrane protein YjfL (UPF0719 family)
MDMVYWDHHYNGILLLNLAIVIALFTSIRLFSGAISHIDSSNELLNKDNPAFGISLAGVILAVTILLGSTMYGDPREDLLESSAFLLAFGVVGIILMAFTRVIFDKIALPDISLRDEIKKGNMAVAIADTGNVLAAAIIISAIMIWVTDNSLGGLVALLVGYGISQVILTGATYVRRKFFSFMYSGRSIQEELKSGNTALALAFAGRKIGTAFAISMAANIVVYEVYDIKTIFLPWIAVCIAFIGIVQILSYIAERIILFKVNTVAEILDDRNIAVGAIQAVIYASVAILISEL